MDFDLTDEQQATIEVAAKLLADKSTPDGLRALEQRRRPALRPRPVGGHGRRRTARHRGARGARRRRARACSSSASCCEEVGRRTAPVPALATLAFGGLPVARFGTAEQQAALAARLAAGTLVPDRGAGRAARRPAGADHGTAKPDGDGWVLDGTQDQRAGRADRRPLARAGRHRRRTASACSSSRPTPRASTRTAPGHDHRHARCAGDARRGAGRRRRRPRPDRRRRSVLRWLRRARHRRRLRGDGGPDRRGGAHHRRVHDQPRAVRPADRHLPGGGPAGRRRLRRQPRHPAHDAPGGVALSAGRTRPAARSRSPSTGPSPAASGSSTRPPTCTAASASTATTRCTATSCWPSSSS